ncbi:EKC/KEOPS complex subunit SPAC4H3.13 [Schizosaccharomyces pombe]
MIVLPHKVTVKVPLASRVDAERCLQVLAPDRELKEELVQRNLFVDDNYLVVNYSCSSARMTRVTVNSLFENLYLIIDTMHELSSL